MVNLHFSLLPRWRGAAPVERAILAGDDAHRRRPDGGGGGARHRRHLRASRGADRARRHARRSSAAGWWSRGLASWSTTLQDGARRRRRLRSVSRPTRTSSSAEDRHLDWSRPAVDVHRRVRLGDAWTTHDGKRLKVWRTHVPPVGDDPTAPAADGPVELVEVQPEGKPRMSGPRLGQRGPVDARRPARAREHHRSGARARCPRSHRARRRLRQPPPARAPRAARASKPRDRHFATELVYGTTRMRRACDFLVDRFLTRDLDLRRPQRAAPGRVPAPLPADGAPRRGGGDRGGGAQGRPRARERRAAPGRHQPRGLARRRHASELPRLDRRAAGRRPRCRRRLGRPRGDEHGPAGDRASRRLRPGPGLPVGGRGGRGRAGGARRRPVRGTRAARPPRSPPSGRR